MDVRKESWEAAAPARAIVTTRDPVRWGVVLAASLLTAGTVVVMWFAAVPWGPIFCVATDPPSPNCVVSNRVGTALIVTIVVVAVGAATLVLAILRPRRGRGAITAGIVLLAIAPVASYLTVAWSPGFDPWQRTTQTTPQPSTGDPIGRWGTPAEGESLRMCATGDTWLSGGRAALVDGDALHILDSSRLVIGALPRQ